MKIIKDEGFLLGILILLFVVVIYSQTVILPGNSTIFPYFLLCVMVLNAVIMIVQSFVYGTGQKRDNGFFHRDVIVIAIALIALYFFLEFLGFYVSCALFALFLYLYLKRSWHLVSFLKGGVFSVIIMLVLYLVFNIGLKLILPSGILI